jgi:hypothetical protein
MTVLEWERTDNGKSDGSCRFFGTLLRAEGYYGVNAGGAARWKKAGDEAAERQQKSYGERNKHIVTVESHGQ